MNRPRFIRNMRSIQPCDSIRRGDDSGVFQELSSGVNAPDLTHSIMGRLGYMPVSPRVARRHRLRQWVGRAGVVLTAALALGIGFNFYLNSAEIRRPIGPTISDAFQHDLQRQQERIGTMIHTIQNLAPRPGGAQIPIELGDDPFEPEPYPLETEEIKESWIAPVRWV